METFTEEHTPAYIVKEFPKASDIFKTYGINFCCKGDILLKDTFANKDLEGNAILHELNSTYDDWKAKGNQATNWDFKSSTEITDHIVDYYHQYLHDELSSLGEFVTRIYRVHGHDSPHLQELYSLYNEFLIEAETHLVKESSDIIPLIQSNDETNQDKLANGIKEVKDRSEMMVHLLNKMRETTSNFEPPIDACGSYRITYARLLDLEKEMMNYIHLENNILFERFAS